MSFLTAVNFLFCFSIFTSKSAVTLFGVLLIGYGLIRFPWRPFKHSLKISTANKLFTSVAALVPLGFLANVISLGGTKQAIEYLRAYPWPLLVFPFYLISQSPRQLKTSVYGLALGALVGVLYSFYQFSQNLGLPPDQAQRISGFWDILRWGTFLAVGTLIFVCLPLNTSNRKHQVAFWILSILTTTSLIMSNTRAPWLALIGGLFVLALLHPSKLKQIATIFFVFAIGLMSNSSLKERFASIFSIQLSPEHITSSNLSNAGRLHMWKVNWDYLKEAPWWQGTGFENSEPYLRRFVANQSSEYQEKYIIETFSFRDQHSSYLSSLVQFGPFFALYFWGLFGLLFIYFFKVALKGHFIGKVLTCSLLAYFIVFVFYSSYSSYEIIPLYAMMGVGLSMIQSLYATTTASKEALTSE